MARDKLKAALTPHATWRGLLAAGADTEPAVVQTAAAARPSSVTETAHFPISRSAFYAGDKPA